MEVASPQPRSLEEPNSLLAPLVSSPAAQGSCPTARATELPASPAPAEEILLPKQRVWGPSPSHSATRHRGKLCPLLAGNSECPTGQRGTSSTQSAARAGQSPANGFPPGASLVIQTCEMGTDGVETMSAESQLLPQADTGPVPGLLEAFCGQHIRDLCGLKPTGTFW